MQFGISNQALQVFSSVVLAIFTVVLALVTGLYYRQSKLQTSEMRKTRELEQEPRMKAGLKPFGPNFELGFVNIGGGIAHSVEAEYWVEGLEEFKREWGTSVHFPGDIHRIGIPLDGSEIGVVGGTQEIEPKLRDSDGAFIVEWSYKNSRGVEFTATDRFNLLEEIEKQTDSTEFYTGEERDVRF